eukprot:m.212747 g.212747  ORF g.212747 m.212747 type:complete len:507 (+) comp17168_c0_seq6:167-1687(+)
MQSRASVSALGHIIESFRMLVQDGVQEAKKGFASLEALVVKQGHNGSEGGTGSRRARHRLQDTINVGLEANTLSRDIRVSTAIVIVVLSGRQLGAGAEEVGNGILLVRALGATVEVFAQTKPAAAESNTGVLSPVKVELRGSDTSDGGQRSWEVGAEDRSITLTGIDTRVTRGKDNTDTKSGKLLNLGVETLRVSAIESLDDGLNVLSIADRPHEGSIFSASNIRRPLQQVKGLSRLQVEVGRHGNSHTHQILNIQVSLGLSQALASSADVSHQLSRKSEMVLELGQILLSESLTLELGASLRSLSGTRVLVVDTVKLLQHLRSYRLAVWWGGDVEARHREGVQATNKLQNSADVSWNSWDGLSTDDGQLSIHVTVGEQVQVQQVGDLSNADTSSDNVLVQVKGESSDTVLVQPRAYSLQSPRNGLDDLSQLATSPVVTIIRVIGIGDGKELGTELIHTRLLEGKVNGGLGLWISLVDDFPPSGVSAAQGSNCHCGDERCGASHGE